MTHTQRYAARIAANLLELDDDLASTEAQIALIYSRAAEMRGYITDTDAATLSELDRRVESLKMQRLNTLIEAQRHLKGLQNVTETTGG